MKSESRHKISIQWHITTNCNNRCRHCYVFDENTYADEKANTLSYDGLIKVLESILDFEKKWNCSIPVFAITGGDPLLRKDWYKFFSALKAYGKSVSLMCNPETLTEENLKLLNNTDVKICQMSLDGLEHTHDYFRSEGSFRRTVAKISDLENHGIRSAIMFTLYPENQNELFPLIRYLDSETPLSDFCVDIGTSTGNGKELSKDFNPQQFKTVLEGYLDLKEEFKNKGRKLQLAKKVRLFELLDYSNDRLNTNYSTAPVAGGCPAGWYSAVILSDGTVLSCRRLPVKAGKMPEQSFEEIFLGSELLKKFRRRKYYKGCSDCMLYQGCRGCPAYVNGITGDPFAKNPLCFREAGEKQIDSVFAEPGIDTTFEEEYNFITSSFNFNTNSFSEKLFKNSEFREIFLRLFDNINERKEFFNNPERFVKQNLLEIDEYDTSALHYYFMNRSRKGEAEDERFSDLIRRLKILHIRDLTPAPLLVERGEDSGFF